MFSRIVLALAVVFASSFAVAGEGTSKLRMSGALGAGYELKMEGDSITGYFDGFGNLSGKVALTKKDGKWSGRLGMIQVKAGSVVQTAENKTKVQMSTLPGGHHSFNFKMKTNELQMNGMMGAGRMVSANMNMAKMDLSVWNQIISMNLRDKAQSGSFKGTTMIRTWQGHYEYISTDLTATGDLNPAMLAKNDHALFVLLHVLPINIFN